MKREEYRPGSAFDEAAYLIATADGQHQTVDGYVHRDGVLAMHRTPANDVIITHIPSGLAVVAFPAWEPATHFILNGAISSLDWHSRLARATTLWAYAVAMKEGQRRELENDAAANHSKINRRDKERNR